MNWPNRLSLLRVALVPFLVLMIYGNTTWTQVFALLLFVGACYTDWLDGHIARKNHIVTNFGKFIDPVADKLLVLSTMIALCGQGLIPAWACIVVLFRELAVDGLRLIASQQGLVIAAGKLGKIKTALQMLTLGLYLLRVVGDFMKPLSEICLYAALVMTIWSGVDYFIRNRSVFTASEGGNRVV